MVAHDTLVDRLVDLFMHTGMSENKKRPLSSSGHELAHVPRAATLRAESNRRQRSTTDQFENMMRTTLKNKAAAVAHLSQLDAELSSTPRGKRASMLIQQQSSPADASADGEGDSEWMRPPPAIPAEFAADHARRATEHQAQHAGTTSTGSPLARRPVSNNFELPDSRSPSGSLDGDPERKSSSSPPPLSHSPARFFAQLSLSEDLSPRATQIKQAAHYRKQNKIMQSFLSGASVEYSYTQLRNCVRAGLSDNLREQFYTTMAMRENSAQLPTVDHLFAHARVRRKDYKAILTDVFRTMPDMVEYDPFFVNSLYRGLVAHAALRPDIGYVQGMNMLWGNIISCVSVPDKQLRVAEHVVREILPYYFTTDLLGAMMDALVIRHYLHRRCPKVERAMLAQFTGGNSHEDAAMRDDVKAGKSRKTDVLDMMLMRWTSTFFPDLFNSVLCTESRKRLWDWLMLDGAVVLVEFTLRLFLYARDQKLLAKSDSWVEFCMHVEQHVRQLDSIDPILRTHLVGGEIELRDFVQRRKPATRITFEEVERRERDEDFAE